MHIAHENLRKFMRNKVDDRKRALDAGEGNKGVFGRDVFSMLVAANQSENERLKLSDQELIGNIFVILFAGHGSYIRASVNLAGDGLKSIFPETTAHTLAATLGFMSLYEDIQDDVVQQILDVVGLDRDPVRHHFPAFRTS